MGLFKKKKGNSLQSDWNDEWNLDRYWLSQELEFQHQSENHKFRVSENNPLKLGRIINSIFDIRKEEVAILIINDGTSLINIETQDEIWDYSFLSAIIQQIESRHKLNVNDHTVIMSLYYRGFDQKDSDKDKSIGKKDGCLLIHLTNASGIREKVLYVQATFCHPPIELERGKKGMFPQPKTISFLIGYDYRTEKEITDEFYSVWNSALNKLETNKANEWTLIEQDLCDLFFKTKDNPPTGLIMQDYYQGKRVMQDNRFWDAIAYFENVFNRFQEKRWKGDELSDDEWKIFIDTSFWIGFCYYELHLFEKAYMYLEIPYIVNSENYNYFTEYVNCLERLQDVRLWSIIDNRLEKIQEKESKSELNEEDWSFILFCFRRKAYLLIEIKQYEDAKMYLEKILEIEPDNEFAKGEMEYINKINNLQ